MTRRMTTWPHLGSCWNPAIGRVARGVRAALTVWVTLSSGAGLVRSEICVYPASVRLTGPYAIQRLMVQRLDGAVAVGDLTEQAVWQSSDDTVVRVENHMAHPVSSGVATLSVRTPEGEAEVPVVVEGFERPGRWEFRRHVLPVLSRAGCNAGACHGALAGKGGFRLSLRGYNPDGDYLTITRESLGRRIELADPGQSLLLAKPTGAVPHKGGLRLDPESREFQVLAEWIQQGAAAPRDDDPRLLRIEVHPAESRLRPDVQQPLLVTAHYADGRQEDVTGWAKFSSSDETVASVDEHGRVTVQGHGEGAVVVWFSSQLALARVVSPFENQVDAGRFTATEQANFVDRLVLRKLAQLNLEPSPRCDDTTFLRRASLDTLGRLPTVAEVQRFVANARLDKRRLLIDDLLTREDYVDYWSYKWSDLLLVSGRRLRPPAVKAYSNWIRGHVAANTRWDEMVREILTATGNSLENGATNFYALHQDPETMSENVCQAFLGLSIGCAKCHNHPLEKWTNDEYYAMANFFSRVKAKGWGGDARSGDGGRTVFTVNQGELMQPFTGQPQHPQPLDGDPLPDRYPEDRREYLADWLVSPDNPYFSRAIVNRVWANFMGRGIVEPVDDLRVSNPARNEPLLAALSDYLVQSEFDLKALMRVILNSETYQRSSVPLPTNQADQHYFSRYFPRRLTAEVLLDAIAQVTDVPSRFVQIGYDGNDVEKTNEYPIGTRAIELYDSAVVSSFLTTFGRNERDITCECERSNTPSIVQVLHLSNGTTINDRLKAENKLCATSIGPSATVARGC